MMAAGEIVNKGNGSLKDNWSGCKNILCIRADNMGDLLMSSPAIAAVKETIGCKITVLTSSSAAGVARLIPDIDDVIVARLPWVGAGPDCGPGEMQKLIALLKERQFDGCIIFNVYSQQTLATAMLAYLADIPLRLAYCRENPYHLLSEWFPDPEPYFYIDHQVKRDLNLVRLIGADTEDESLRLSINPSVRDELCAKLKAMGIDPARPVIIMHAGVSEEKRRYPEELWIATGKQLLSVIPEVQLLLTGSAGEEGQALEIANGIGERAFAVAGIFSLEEFATLINVAEIIISVNTGTIHLAAALKKPVVVLYAQTNPQHSPWMTEHELLEYSVPTELQSRNQVIRFVNEKYYPGTTAPPAPQDVVESVKELLFPVHSVR